MAVNLDMTAPHRLAMLRRLALEGNTEAARDYLKAGVIIHALDDLKLTTAQAFELLDATGLDVANIIVEVDRG